MRHFLLPLGLFFLSFPSYAVNTMVISPIRLDTPHIQSNINTYTIPIMVDQDMSSGRLEMVTTSKRVYPDFMIYTTKSQWTWRWNALSQPEKNHISLTTQETRIRSALHLRVQEETVGGGINLNNDTSYECDMTLHGRTMRLCDNTPIFWTIMPESLTKIDPRERGQYQKIERSIGNLYYSTKIYSDTPLYLP